MSHIFISYSRKDVDFAGKIVQALADNALDTWIDWKSIPKGEDWAQEIYRGIEEADAFLFLISPDSVTSQMCNKEIEHAVKNGKRILPVVIRDTGLKNIHPEISKRNWIFCRDGQDDFDKAIEETRQTIHTDYEWLKYHTELQVKALKWEKTKDASRLLRGRELREAEEQLAQKGSLADPLPTPLQHHFLLVSRNGEIQQRRRFAIGLTIGLFFMVIIAFVAKGQWDEATSQRATAQAESTARAKAQAQEQIQRQIALARNLAELSRKLSLPDSQIFLGQDSPSGNAQSIAVLLAIESIKRNPTFEGSQALIASLAHLPLVVTRQNFSTDGSITVLESAETEKFSKIYMNADQSQIFKLSRITRTDYALKEWSVSEWQTIRSTDISVPDETGLSLQPPVVLSINTEWFSYIGRSGIVLQRTSKDLSELIWETNGPFSALQFSLDSKFLLASKQDGTIKVWSVNTQEEIAAITVAPGANSVSFNGNGSLLIVETGPIEESRSDVYVYDIQSNKLLKSFPNSSYLGSDDTGDLLALSFGNQYGSNNIHIWNMALDTEMYSIDNECLLSFIQGSENILTTTQGDSGTCLSGLGNPIHIFDIKEKQKIFELELDGLAWAREVNSEVGLAAISTGRKVYIIDIKGMKVSTEITLDFIVDTLEFSPDGSVLIMANKSPLPIVGANHSFNAIIWDLKNNVEVGRIPHDNFIYSLAFLQDSSSIIIADSKGNLTVWAVKDFWRHQVFEFQHDRPAAMPGSVASNWTFAIPVYSSTGKQLAIGGGNGNLETFDTLSNQQIFSFTPIDLTLSDELTYSSDDRWLAFTGLFCQQGSCPNNVKILDVENNSFFLIDQMEPTYEAKVAFSPDSRYLAIMWSGDQNILHVWDTNQWKMLKEIDAGSQGWREFTVSFTSDGDHLVLADPGEDGHLMMFDVSSWEKAFEINSPAGPIAFWDEGNLLVASSYDPKNLTGMVRTVNTNSNNEVSAFQYDTKLKALAFSSDGGYLSAIDYLDNLITWETSTGNAVSTKFIPDIGNVLIASPDHPSWFIVNTGNDILIVDVSSGTEIERIVTGEFISALSISPDGKYIASGGANGKVQIWYWRPEDLISEACIRLPRNLTQAEWKQYLGNEPYSPTCPDLPIPSE